MERNDPGPCRPSSSPPREGFASSEDRTSFLSAHLPLFEGFPLALLLTDPEDGRTVFANREALSLLAAAPEELLDRVFPHGWKPLATLDGTPLAPEKAIPRDFREGTTGPLSFTLPSRKGELNGTDPTRGKACYGCDAQAPHYTRGSRGNACL